MDRSVPPLAWRKVNEVFTGEMLMFRCSKKVRDLLGLRDHDLSDETEGGRFRGVVRRRRHDRTPQVPALHAKGDALQLLGDRREES
jgi:hypothetical protein